MVSERRRGRCRRGRKWCEAAEERWWYKLKVTGSVHEFDHADPRGWPRQIDLPFLDDRPRADPCRATKLNDILNYVLDFDYNVL